MLEAGLEEVVVTAKHSQQPAHPPQSTQDLCSVPVVAGVVSLFDLTQLQIHSVVDWISLSDAVFFLFRSATGSDDEEADTVALFVAAAAAAADIVHTCPSVSSSS